MLNINKLIKNFIKHFLLLILIITPFLITSTVYSAEILKGKNTVDTIQSLKNLGDKGGFDAAKTAAGQTSIASIIATIINSILGLLGIIFLILTLYAGFNWMTAAGDEEKVTKAKETLTRAIIGLIIIVCAYSITTFVFSRLPD